MPAGATVTTGPALKIGMPRVGGAQVPEGDLFDDELGICAWAACETTQRPSGPAGSSGLSW